MDKLPKLKKKISSFLIKEEGKISKESLIKTGILLSAIAIASLKSVNAGTTAGCPLDDTAGNSATNLASSHCNELNIEYNDATANTEHNHGTHNSY
jgi:hypothetical protein